MKALDIRRRILSLLNTTLIRVGGRSWPWLFEPAIRSFWLKRDRSAAWPDFQRLIDLAPNQIWGGVGGDSYTGWIYQQGFFAALVRSWTDAPSLTILDFGCGLGKLATIAPDLTYPNGQYLGVDIRPECIAFCNRQYGQLPRTRFFLSADTNQTYSNPDFFKVPEIDAQPPLAAPKSGMPSYGADWPAQDESVDVVIGVSVFTHLKEDEALEYVVRIRRLLRPGGLLIQSVLVVDESSIRSTHFDDPILAAVHHFHTSLPPSHNFFTSSAEHPENAIAMNQKGLETLLGEGFKLERLMRGSVMGGHDPFPQDILIARKR